MNLLNFCYPGVYEIFCKETQRSYFGQSENVLYRLGRHYNNLQRQIHDVSALQEDWLRYGPHAFVFQPLECGPEWSSLDARLAREGELLKNCPHDLYNTKKPTATTFRKEWIIDGMTYSSGAEAARSLGLSTSTVYRQMKKQGGTKIVSNNKKISIDGQEFESLTQAQSALNLGKSTLYRRLRSSKWPTWFYCEKTRSNDYPERE